MSNDLIQKNAELGRFLFCERYTLQPVKNSLFIAEGQDLKRGAVVDVNGVLVGTNSLMPYAVLENDCDTRAKGAFASVFVKGEFNFDKLFFADGLSNEDLDNIVYNGSGIGLVIKPYSFSSGFTPKSDKKELSYIKQLLTNPLNLPDKTIRCKFTSGYTPTMGTSQTLVDADENVWDITKNSNDWERLLNNNSHLLQVIGANTSSVTNMSRLFAGCTNLTSVALFDTSAVTNMQYMFNGTLIESVPLFDTSSVTVMKYMFYGCSQLKSVPLFDTSSVTDVKHMFYSCFALKSVPLFDTSSVTDMRSMLYLCSSITYLPPFDLSSVITIDSAFSECPAVTGGALELYQRASVLNPQPSHFNTFRKCGNETVEGAAELAQIPESWGGTAAG